MPKIVGQPLHYTSSALKSTSPLPLRAEDPLDIETLKFARQKVAAVSKTST